MRWTTEQFREYEQRRTRSKNIPNPKRLQDAKQCEQPKALEGDSKREAQFTGRAHVCFTLRRVNLLDVDAKYCSVKDLLDGCRYAGLIRGDTENDITLEVKQERVKHYKDEEVQIEITKLILEANKI